MLFRSEKLDGVPAQVGDDQVDPKQQAEQVGAPDGVDGAPGGEDDQGHGQPAQGFNGAVVGPGALDIVHGVVQAAEAGDPGAHAGGHTSSNENWLHFSFELVDNCLIVLSDGIFKNNYK